MDQDNNAQRKRVSFVPETKINYIYQEESTTKTSSFYSDAPMDITTELEDLKNLNLLTSEEKNEENVKLKKLSTLGRKSLNPLDNIEFHYSESNNKEERNQPRKSLNPFDKISFDYEINNEINNENGAVVEENLKNHEKSMKDVENKAKSISLFWNIPVKNREQKNLEGTFENQGSMNSSFDAIELVNTIDLKKIIPQSVNEVVDVTEFLATQGIRFLDETAIEGMKRDTLSKSRNTVDPSLVIYYQFCLKERIDFLFNFSNFLIDKMKDLEREIELVSKSIDIKSINKDNLKRIRNDSRNKSKIDWYSLRKIYEIQFNKKILENRNTVLDMLESAKLENQRTIESVDIKKKSVALLKQQILNLESNVNQLDQKSVQKIENIAEIIEDKKVVLTTSKNDLEKIGQALESQNNEESIIQKRIIKLQGEIGNLKKNLSVKNVSETQLDEIKKVINRYRTMYNFNITKMSNYSLVFEIGEISITTEFNSSMDVIRNSLVNSSSCPFYEFISSIINNISGLKLTEFIKKCLETYSFIQALKKEITMLKERVKIETFYVNSCLYLRIFTLLGTECFDISINISLDLLSEGQYLASIKESPGFLSTYVNSKIIN